jgi:hypothetical protein
LTYKKIVNYESLSIVVFEAADNAWISVEDADRGDHRDEI